MPAGKAQFCTFFRFWILLAMKGESLYNRESLLKEKIGPDEVHLARPSGNHRRGHRRDFLDCVRTRARTITPIETAHRSATVAHLGNIAMLLGRKIRWNPKREQILDDPTTNRMLIRPIRSPWHL